MTVPRWLLVGMCLVAGTVLGLGARYGLDAWQHRAVMHGPGTPAPVAPPRPPPAPTVHDPAPPDTELAPLSSTPSWLDGHLEAAPTFWSAQSEDARTSERPEHQALGSACAALARGPERGQGPVPPLADVVRYLVREGRVLAQLDALGVDTRAFRETTENVWTLSGGLPDG